MTSPKIKVVERLSTSRLAPSTDIGLEVDVGPSDPTLGGHRHDVGDQQPQGHARRAGNDRRADEQREELQTPHKKKIRKNR